MSELSRILHLLRSPVVGYHHGGAPATEPTALATLLLMGANRSSAQEGLRWLLRQQQTNGAVSVEPNAESPCWTTSLALLSFTVGIRAGAANRVPLHDGASRALDWILNHRGEPIDLPADQEGTVFGHDTRLVAWPWVLGTHSWFEPTCLHVIALRAAGRHSHPRCVEALQLLGNRLLPQGGANYGNTSVLGQMLRPHLQPSGMAAVALAGTRHKLAGPTLQPTLAYLQTEAARTSAAASLAWAALGLLANDQPVPQAALERSLKRNLVRSGSPYRLALLGHALLGRRSALLSGDASEPIMLDPKELSDAAS